MSLADVKIHSNLNRVENSELGRRRRPPTRPLSRVSLPMGRQAPTFAFWEDPLSKKWAENGSDAKMITIFKV